MDQRKNPRFAICKLFKWSSKILRARRLKKCVVSDAFVKNIYTVSPFYIGRYSRDDTNTKNYFTLNEPKFSVSEYNIILIKA